VKCDRDRARRAIDEFLRALGRDPEGELQGTGQRVADAWIDELVSGEGVDARALLADAIDLGPGPHGAIVLRDLKVASMCPHHLLPSHGKATIGYLPRRKAAGLGTLAQVVDTLARRLTLQESLGDAIAKTLLEGLDAEGAFCRLALHHTCFIARGERQASAVVETVALCGAFAADQRAFALALLGPSTSGS
jgi:GTP cyclohydrolase I